MVVLQRQVELLLVELPVEPLVVELQPVGPLLLELLVELQLGPLLPLLLPELLLELLLEPLLAVEQEDFVELVLYSSLVKFVDIDTRKRQPSTSALIL